MAMVTSSALPRYRGSFMSINASLQQMAIGLAAVIAGAVIGEAESGELTGYPIVGLIAAVSTGISMLLAGRLRVAHEIAETSMAVDSPEDSLPDSSLAVRSVLRVLTDKSAGESADPERRAS